MTHRLPLALLGWLVTVAAASGQDLPSLQPAPPPAQQAGVGPAGAGAQAAKPSDPQAPSLQEILDRTAREIKALKEEHAREVERQQKQAELQQKQIEVLERTAQLLADQIRKQTPAATTLDALESKAAVQEARSRQSARRDADLADVIDGLGEDLDAVDRRNRLPYTARELFLPTQANETPLAIYGQIVGGYSKQNGRSGLFGSPVFGPWFLLQLNNKFLLEVNLDFSTSGVGIGQAQLDWFLADWLTLSAGRFLTPIGSFNERLGPEWINKLPDIPVMFRQVVPLTSTDGLQLRGARYLGDLPLKVEYSAYAGNGFQFAQRPTALTQVADIQGLTGNPDEVTSAAYGGRVGLWAPLPGLNFGVSGYTNGIYSPGSKNHYDIVDFDFNYHRGNWDFRAEVAHNHQQATSFLGHNIDRRGAYAQVAYRDYPSPHRYLRNLEYVFRYGFADFHGINAARLDQTAFGSTFDVPVTRNQYTFGVNYYFYPSMALKLAYEINRERGLKLSDDIFLAQAVWAF